MKQFAIALGLVILTACSSSEETSYAFTISTEEGVNVAVTRGGPKYSGELFRYEEILTLTEDTANDESVLFRPGTIKCDEDGFFYVQDSGDNRIAVFGPGGDYIRSFGRDGQGPGEFSRITATVLWSGVFSLFDSSLNRTTRYQTDGTLLDVTTIPPTVLNARQGPARDMHLLEDGTMLLMQWVSSEDDEAQYMQKRLLAISPERDTLWVVETPVVQTSLQTRMSSGGTLSFGYPFAGFPEVLYHPAHGIVVSDGITPELHWYDTTGRMVRKIRAELEPVPLTAGDMAKVKARSEERLQSARESGQSMSIEFAETMLKALKYPEFHPVWRSVTLSDEGYLWLQVVEHTADREALGGGYLFRVISPDGEYLGDTRVQYGSGFTLSGDRLMTTWYPPDSDEYQMLVCRIVPAVPGLEFPH